MRRKLLLAVGCVVAVGSVVGAASPAGAAEPVLVKVCVTLNPKSLAITVNGTPILKNASVGQPRTCAGI